MSHATNATTSALFLAPGEVLDLGILQEAVDSMYDLNTGEALGYTLDTMTHEVNSRWDRGAWTQEQRTCSIGVFKQGNEVISLGLHLDDETGEIQVKGDFYEVTGDSTRYAEALGNSYIALKAREQSYSDPKLRNTEVTVEFNADINQYVSVITSDIVE